MSVLCVPDLGEGLHEAEIAEWHVRAGQRVEAGEPLVSLETDKAIVEVPSPRSGSIERLWGKPGDVLRVGARLVQFADGAEHAPRDGARPADGVDAGTVVGRVEATGRVAKEAPGQVEHAAAGVRTTPAVRALARRLDVDLAIVTPSGPEDTVTARDVQRVARILKEVGPLEPLRGVRRAMARSMAQAREEVVPATVFEDADVDAWPARTNVLLRLIRAIVVACRAEPALNAWFDSRALGRRVLDKIDLGVAMDTPDGLFVPVLRNVGERSPDDLLRGLEALKEGVASRKIPPEDLRGNTFTLSNFGVFGGRYANPVVVPPTVAILGAGRMREAVVAADGRPVVHRLLPLSLTFDHRAVSGGEATRFLTAAIGDLERGQ